LAHGGSFHGHVHQADLLDGRCAAMIGAAFIMADPIFQGLAISLVFGLASSTALTVNVSGVTAAA
jgi:hypothetical protein